MSEVVKRLLERRANCVTQMREVAERAVEEGRPMTAEEDRQFTEWNSEVDALQIRADAFLAGETRAKEIEDSFANLAGKPKERQDTPGAPGTDLELRDWMRGKGARHYELEQRDLTTSSSGVIDTGFRAQLWEYLVETSGILNAGVDVLETASGETIKLPRVTAYNAVAAATEASAITENDATLSSVNSTVTKVGFVTQLSSELVADSGVDLTGMLARNAGRDMGNAIGAAAVTAALAAAPAGVTTSTGTPGTLGTQSTAGQGFDYLISLFHSVIFPYRNRPSCSWLMNDLTAALVRKVKSSTGEYAWVPSVQVGVPDTILGKPVYIDYNMPAIAISVEAIIFGDFSSLVTRVAGGFRFERSDDFAFNADLVTYRALVRHGTVSIDANALKTLTMAAT
jgi:HK97 family phage major capsid protein